MAYLVASTSPNIIINDCHPIGHIVGADTYQKAGSIERALTMCPEDCRSACLHGVLGSAILGQLGQTYADQDIVHGDDATIEKEGAPYCAQSWSLCHALGHILYTVDNIQPAAFQACNKITSNAFGREVCYQGIFMERGGQEASLTPFQGNMPETNGNDYTYPCLTVAEAYRHACFQFLSDYQNILFAKNGIIASSSKLSIAAHACQNLSGKDRESCYEGIGIGSQIYGYGRLDPKTLQPLCDGFPTLEDRTSCTIGVVPRFLFLNVSPVRYCSDIKEESRKTVCFEDAFELFISYATQTSSTSALSICNKSTECMSQYNDYEQNRLTIPNYRFGFSGTP